MLGEVWCCWLFTVEHFVVLWELFQDSDDEGNEDEDKEEKPSDKREFVMRSPSPPAEDSEPELTEDLKEELLVSDFPTLKQTVSVNKS